MAITVKFENPPGNELPTRTFEPGQQLRIGGHVDATLLSGSSLRPVTMDLSSDTDSFAPITISSSTNILGDFWFDIVLPDVVSQASLLIVVDFLIGDDEQKIVSIGIGTNPKPEPKPVNWLVIGLGVAAVALVVTGVTIFKKG